MEDLYPEDIDDKGFLFYPIQAIISFNEEFNTDIKEKENQFIFAEYMQKSWWYGCKVIDSENYLIGIIPYPSKFKPITNSLSDFIKLYIEDSLVLYGYI